MDAIINVAAGDIRPRLRGWLHLWAGTVSVATGIVLISVAGAARGERAGLATAVYAVTVLALFSTSASYHRVSWSTRGRAVMRRLDHSMIFVLIAGTYTPFALLADVLAGQLDPSALFGMSVPLRDVADGYVAMDTRKALKVHIEV